MKNILVLVAVIFAFNSCQTINTPMVEIGLFDVSKDDSLVVFSVYHKSGASIYGMSIDGSQLKEVVLATRDSSFFNPKYSHDGKQMLFIGSAHANSDYHDIYIADADGTHRKKLTQNQKNISEAVFSKCADEIYYIQSAEFGKSSPLGKNQLHGTDVYSLKIADGSMKKITDLYAYAIFRVSEIDCEHLLIDVPYTPSGEMNMISKSNPKNLISINPVNDPRKNISFYSELLYSEKYDWFAFQAPYEIYTMPLKTKIAKLVTKSDQQIGSVSFLNKQKKILYTLNNETSFYMVNFDGTNSVEIKIPLGLD